MYRRISTLLRYAPVLKAGLKHPTSSPLVVSRALGVDVLPPNVKKFVEENEKLCEPNSVYVCDGSEEENSKLIDNLVKNGRLSKLTKYDNCYLARTSKDDVARVEAQTYISVSYTHLRAHETVLDLVCRLLLEKKK